ARRRAPASSHRRAPTRRPARAHDRQSPAQQRAPGATRFAAEITARPPSCPRSLVELLELSAPFLHHIAPLERQLRRKHAVFLGEVLGDEREVANAFVALELARELVELLFHFGPHLLVGEKIVDPL